MLISVIIPHLDQEAYLRLGLEALHASVPCRETAMDQGRGQWIRLTLNHDRIC